MEFPSLSVCSVNWILPLSLNQFFPNQFSNELHQTSLYSNVFSCSKSSFSWLYYKLFLILKKLLLFSTFSWKCREFLLLFLILCFFVSSRWTVFHRFSSPFPSTRPVSFLSSLQIFLGLLFCSVAPNIFNVFTLF